MSPVKIKEVGPGYTVPHNFVEKENSTTPLRLVTNSSFKSPSSGLSLNDITLKGPSSLNSLHSILLRFRAHRVGLVGDLSKMCHSVMIHPDQRFLRRILWREPQHWGTPFSQNQPEVYNINTVTFGDKPAGCGSTTALRNTAQMYEHINPRAAQAVINSTYVDDLVTGEENVERAKQLIEDVKKITEPGGFVFKKFLISGDHAGLKSEGQGMFGGLEEKVFGLRWNPAEDTLQYVAHVNPSKKRRGKKIANDWKPEDIGDLSHQDLTRGKLLRIVNSLFDPIGIISPFTVLLKINMKKVNGYKWDERIPVSIAKKWIDVLEAMMSFKASVPRSIMNGVPAEYIGSTLVGFGDASLEAYAAVIRHFQAISNLRKYIRLWTAVHH